LRQPTTHQRTAWTINLNIVAAGLLSGLASGIIAGVLARIAMRIVALLVDQQPDISLTGTLGIIVIFGLMGLLLALLYLGLRRIISFAIGWQGILYGSVLAVLTIWLFFANAEGELGIISPWIGASLFAPIALFYGIVMDMLLRRYEQRAKAARPVPVFWFCAFALSVLITLIRIMDALNQGYLRTPAAIQQLYAALGVGYDATRDVHGLLGLVIGLLYCGLCIVIFWQGYRSRAIQLSAIGLVLLGGLVLPAGTFQPQTMTGVPGRDVEWLSWSLIFIGWIGSLWLVQRWAKKPANTLWRQTFARLSIALVVGVGAFLLMWLAILLIPGLQLRRMNGFYTAFATPIYLWPWLFCPLALLAAMRHQMPSPTA
jgi:hypothetical protein